VILVDSSVWIAHLRAADAVLVDLLLRERVLVHPFVIGEIALGHVRERDFVLGLLRALPASVVARDEEVAELIERERLFGQGIGYVDAHLLASARLTVGAGLWTHDRWLGAVAERIGVGAELLQ
jgi:predicted nucleic acid-binding protein